MKQLPSDHPCPGCGRGIAGKARTCAPCKRRICKLCRGFHPDCRGGRCPDCKGALGPMLALHQEYDAGPPPNREPGRVEALAERARRGVPLFG